jgi:anaerobic selenocysteine-containing dehydrogenase
MDRREFVKMIGIGGVLAGMGALLGSGCAREPEPEAEAPPVAGEAPAPEAVEMVTTCPNCGAENKVEQWGVKMTCWKCGHTWTPEKPA